MTRGHRDSCEPRHAPRTDEGGPLPKVRTATGRRLFTALAGFCLAYGAADRWWPYPGSLSWFLWCGFRDPHVKPCSVYQQAQLPGPLSALLVGQVLAWATTLPLFAQWLYRIVKLRVPVRATYYWKVRAFLPSLFAVTILIGVFLTGRPLGEPCARTSCPGRLDVRALRQNRFAAGCASEIRP